MMDQHTVRGHLPIVPPGQRGLVPHGGQPPLQVEPAAAVVEAVPDLVAEHEAEAAVREAARHPGHGARVGQRGEQRQGQHHAGQRLLQQSLESTFK